MNTSIRINFDKQEHENILFLMNHMGYGTPQKLIRFMVADKSSQIKEFSNRYGPKTARAGDQKRSNKETRLNEMLTLPVDELNQKLEELHVFEPFRSSPDMQVWVENTRNGGRTLKFYQKLPGGGEQSGERNFGDVISELRKVI